jgi:hypothetical protein
MCTNPYIHANRSLPGLKASPEDLTEIFICDLDGCLWETVFPSLQGELLLADERQQLVRDLNQRLRSIKLYPNFLGYYERCSPEKIIFVTGRKKEDFGAVTKHQLKQLRSDKAYTSPLYYPSEEEHTRKLYLEFKIVSITDVVITLTEQYPNSLIKIFDDDHRYFDTLHFYFEKAYEGEETPYFKTYWVQSNEDWANPEDHIYQVHRRGY